MKKTFQDYGITDIVNGRSVCPQCSHERKKKNVRCLSVNEQDGCWYCHHCSWSGGLGEVVIVKTYHKPNFKPSQITDKAQAYFLKRGISKEVLDRNQISYTKHYIPQLEEETTCIAFPYYRGDEVINVKYRDGKKNFCMERGAERILYGLNDLSETTIIVEGEIDKLSLDMVGFTNSVSVPDGAPSVNTKNYQSKFTYLDADEEKIKSVKQWIIATDNDEPGIKLREELARRLGRENCLYVEWKEVKDANECLIKLGALKLKEFINHAKPFPIKGAIEVDQISDKITHLFHHGYEKGKLTGIFELEDFYTIREGEMSVITGIPGHGKSNFVDNIMVNMARRYDWNFAMFTPENYPMDDHAGRIIEKYIGKPFNKGINERITETELEQGKEWVNNHFTWLYPDGDDSHSLDNVLSIAKQLVFKKGIQGLVIDPWNEVEHDYSGSMTQYVSSALKKIKRFARENDVHVWLVAHPTKLKKNDDGSYSCPTPYDIADSAHFRNKADCCLAIYVPDYSEPTIEIHIQKIKFRQIGKVGTAYVKFNRVIGTYQSLSRGEMDEAQGYL